MNDFIQSELHAILDSFQQSITNNNEEEALRAIQTLVQISPNVVDNEQDRRYFIEKTKFIQNWQINSNANPSVMQLIRIIKTMQRVQAVYQELYLSKQQSKAQIAKDLMDLQINLMNAHKFQYQELKKSHAFEIQQKNQRISDIQSQNIVAQQNNQTKFTQQLNQTLENNEKNLRNQYQIKMKNLQIELKDQNSELMRRRIQQNQQFNAKLATIKKKNRQKLSNIQQQWGITKQFSEKLTQNKQSLQRIQAQIQKGQFDITRYMELQSQKTRLQKQNNVLNTQILRLKEDLTRNEIQTKTSQQKKTQSELNIKKIIEKQKYIKELTQKNVNERRVSSDQQKIITKLQHTNEISKRQITHKNRQIELLQLNSKKNEQLLNNYKDQLAKNKDKRIQMEAKYAKGMIGYRNLVDYYKFHYTQLLKITKKLLAGVKRTTSTNQQMFKLIGNAFSTLAKNNDTLKNLAQTVNGAIDVVQQNLGQLNTEEGGILSNIQTLASHNEETASYYQHVQQICDQKLEGLEELVAKADTLITNFEEKLQQKGQVTVQDDNIVNQMIRAEQIIHHAVDTSAEITKDIIESIKTHVAIETGFNNIQSRNQPEVLDWTDEANQSFVSIPNDARQNFERYLNPLKQNSTISSIVSNATNFKRMLKKQRAKQLDNFRNQMYKY